MPSKPNRGRILFVDDEASIRLTMPRILQGHGWDVDTAASVVEATTKIASANYKALITDLHLARHAEGFEILHEMRQKQPSCRCFVITGYPDLGSRIESLHDKVDAYFFKPIEIPEFLKVLDEKLA